MARFGKKSKENLTGINPKLIELFEAVVKDYDCSIVCGLRTQEQQEILYKKGLSKTLKSKHLTGDAVDVYPYFTDCGISYDLTQCGHFAGYVKGIAKMLDIDIIWGGDWKNTNQLTSTKFKDYGHFELKRRD